VHHVSTARGCAFISSSSLGRVRVVAMAATARPKNPSGRLASARGNDRIGSVVSDTKRYQLERDMQTVKAVIWQEDDSWVGYLQDYPDYWTQGDSLDDLKEHLKDVYADLSAGLIPSARRVEDLIIS